MKPSTRRAVLAGLRLAAVVLEAAATRRARSTGDASSGAGGGDVSRRPGALETRRRPDGVFEVIL